MSLLSYIQYMQEAIPRQIEEYITAEGRVPFSQWLKSLNDRKAHELEFAWTASAWVTSAIVAPWAVASMNFDSTMDLVTASILVKSENGLFYFWLAVLKNLNKEISLRPETFGLTSGGESYEQDIKTI